MYNLKQMEKDKRKQMTRKSLAEVEIELDNLIDIRLSARSKNDYATIEKTQEKWDKVREEYFGVLGNVDAPTEDQKKSVKKSLKGIEGA